MANPVIEVGNTTNLTATGNVCTKPGRLIGFYVNSTNAGTLVLKDGGASGTALGGTITPAIGFHAYPAHFGTSLHATIAGSALDVTFFFQPGA